MRMCFCALIVGIIAIIGMSGCASSAESMKTPTDTQPRSYMNDVTNPQNQPQYQRNGALHY